MELRPDVWGGKRRRWKNYMRHPEQDSEKDSMPKLRTPTKVKEKGPTQESVVPVSKNDQNTVSAFLSLGRDYFKDMPSDRRKKFIQSILARL
jgi:hypothetical protein